MELISVSIILAPLLLTFGMGVGGAVAGLLCSPLAAVMSLRQARRMQLDVRRYTIAGIASSVFLLIPWFILANGLRRGRPSDSALRVSFILILLLWLAGPMLMWGQVVAQIDILLTFGLWSSTSGKSPPYYPLLGYTGFTLMAILWAVSAITGLRRWNSAYDIGIDELASVRGMLPFAGAWISTVAVLGYLFLVPR